MSTIDEALRLLLDAVEADLAKIDAEADGKRRAVLARAGVSEELIRELRGDSRLSLATNHATIGAMSSTEIVAPLKKRRGPPSEGPVTDLAVELGFASMQDLADALKEDSSNLRSWNRRKSIPARAEPAIARLRAKRAASKRNDKS